MTDTDHECAAHCTCKQGLGRGGDGAVARGIVCSRRSSSTTAAALFLPTALCPRLNRCSVGTNQRASQRAELHLRLNLLDTSLIWKHWDFTTRSLYEKLHA